MKILFFGQLGDAIGREVHVQAPDEGCTVAELRALLANSYPEAQASLGNKRARACVKDVIVDEQFRLDPQAEVEFFPPLSGG